MAARRPVDVDRFLAELDAGAHDDRLVQVISAVRQRANVISVRRWRITVGKESWDEDTVTMGEVMFVEKFTGKTWGEIDSPLESAATAATFMVAHFVKVDGDDPQDAVERAEALTPHEVMNAVTEYQADLPAPKADSASPI
jgi:hypothetical protein